MNARLDSLIGRVAATCTGVLFVSMLGAVTVMSTAKGRAWIAGSSSSLSSYSAGQRLDLDDAVFRGTAFTLVYFARESCSACREVIPAIAKLIADLKETSDVRAVLVATGNSLDLSKAPDLAKALGVSSADLLTMAPDALSRIRLRRVPTLVAVNRDGAILFIEHGAPSLSQPDLRSRVEAALGLRVNNAPR